MALRYELLSVGACLLSVIHFRSQEKHEECLSLDLGELHVAVWISVLQQLLSDLAGQRLESGSAFFCQVLYDLSLCLLFV